MTDRPLIDDYVATLQQALSGGLRRRMRMRVMVEAEDHLLSTVEDLVLAGRSEIEAQRVAVERFGPAAEVAAAHLRAVVVRVVQRAAVASLVAAISFAGLFILATQVATVRAGLPAHAVSTGAAGVATWVAVQVAFASAFTTLARPVILRCAGDEPLIGDLRLVVRGAGVIAATLGASLLLDLNGFRRMPAGEGQHAGLVFGLTTLTFCLTALTLGYTWAARRRLAALARLGDHGRDLDAERSEATDLVQVFGIVRGVVVRRSSSAERLPFVGAGVRLVDRWMVSTAQRLPSPWAIAGAGAAAVGVLAGLSHLLAEGPSTRGVASTLLVLTIVASIESLLVFVGYALLGPVLGWHPRLRRVA